MKLEDQVCSLELAKRLKELGVRQESAFYWVCHKGVIVGPAKWFLWFCKDGEDRKFIEEEYDEIISAFTVAELGEIMPPYFHTHRLNNGKWKGETDEDIADTEADARAKMLIHLIEKRIVRP